MSTEASRFDTAEADRIRHDLIDYTSAAIDEWNQGGNRSPAADAALANLYATYDRMNPATDRQKNLVTSGYANLDKLGQARTVRLLTDREDAGPPWPLWTVILLTSALVLGTAITYGVEKPRMHHPMVIIVGLIVAANLFLIMELSHPLRRGARDDLRPAAGSLCGCSTHPHPDRRRPRTRPRAVFGQIRWAATANSRYNGNTVICLPLNSLAGWRPFDRVQQLVRVGVAGVFPRHQCVEKVDRLNAERGGPPSTTELVLAARIRWR